MILQENIPNARFKPRPQMEQGLYYSYCITAIAIFLQSLKRLRKIQPSAYLFAKAKKIVCFFPLVRYNKEAAECPARTGLHILIMNHSRGGSRRAPALLQPQNRRSDSKCL